MKRSDLFSAISAERDRQDAKWGYPQENTFSEWAGILAEESGEAAKELNELNFGRGDKQRLIAEVIHTAAVCVSILEQYDTARAVTERWNRERGKMDAET